MQPDRTTKSLLFMITVALWGLLIKGLFAPAPSVAGVPQPVLPVQIVDVRGSLPVNVVRQEQPVEVQMTPSHHASTVMNH